MFAPATFEGVISHVAVKALSAVATPPIFSSEPPIGSYDNPGTRVPRLPMLW